MRSEIEELQVRVVGGVSLRVLRRGLGPIRCLFLHGNPGGADDWLELFSLLPESFQLAAVDLPGFGGSDRLGARWQSLSLERMAEATCGLLDALGWSEPAYLIATHTALVASRVSDFVATH